MAKIARPLEAIENELGVQLRLLQKSITDFDNGDLDEYRRIAVAIRILLHDTPKSTSILGHLDLKDNDFIANGGKIFPGNLIPDWPLAMIMHASGRRPVYVPTLDRSPFPMRLLSFEEWWTEIVFQSPDGKQLNRKGFVLHTANQAGGAHMDAELDAVFNSIANENAAGIHGFDGSESFPILHLEKVYVRHIGGEVVATLGPLWTTIQGNRACDCGSGRKHRYCHGKNIV